MTSLPRFQKIWFRGRPARIQCESMRSCPSSRERCAIFRPLAGRMSPAHKAPEPRRLPGASTQAPDYRFCPHHYDFIIVGAVGSEYIPFRACSFPRRTRKPCGRARLHGTQATAAARPYGAAWHKKRRGTAQCTAHTVSARLHAERGNAPSLKDGTRGRWDAGPGALRNLDIQTPERPSAAARCAVGPARPPGRRTAGQPGHAGRISRRAAAHWQ